MSELGFAAVDLNQCGAAYQGIVQIKLSKHSFWYKAAFLEDLRI